MSLQRDEILVASEAAAYLRIGRTKLYSLIKHEGLPVMHFGRRVVVLRAELLQWVAQRSTRPSDPAAQRQAVERVGEAQRKLEGVLG